jgi:hypothetical protein
LLDQKKSDAKTNGNKKNEAKKSNRNETEQKNCLTMKIMKVVFSFDVRYSTMLHLPPLIHKARSHPPG